MRLALPLVALLGFALPVRAEDAPPHPGKKAYDAKCASCHAKDGKGNAAMLKMFKAEPKALSLVDESAKDKGGFLKVANEGRAKMPAFKEKLKPEELDPIFDYVLTLVPKEEAATGDKPVEKAEAPAIDAAALYKAKCAMCHGPEGKGKLPNTALTAPKGTDEELFKTIKDGKGKMPKYVGKLKDEEITALVGFIRSLGGK